MEASRAEDKVQPAPLGVSELLGNLSALLEEEFAQVSVCGELCDLFRSERGHFYFRLKDDDAQLRAVLFRAAAKHLSFELDDGLELVAHGELNLYAVRGELQLMVRALEPLGQGALQLAFEQLRARLEAEGLFDAAAKRALPRFPRCVAVVTSPVGAAVRDVTRVSAQRFPGVPLLIAPTRVQGDGAEREIIAALARAQAEPDVEVVLLVRGGGSLEDFQAFNSEGLARAIRACAVPVVSGVGHEVDFTIADFAADARAPTPSAAAALALPDRAFWRQHIVTTRAGLARGAKGQVAMGRVALSKLDARLHAHAPAVRLALRRQAQQALWGRLRNAFATLLPLQRQRLDAAFEGLQRAGDGALAPARTRLTGALASLDALSPLAVLARGYAIATGPDGRIVRRATALSPGALLTLRVHEGELETQVRAVRAREGDRG